MVAGVVIIAFALAGSVAKPIQRLAAPPIVWATGTSPPVRATWGAAEVQDLGRSFDAMAARLEATVRAQRGSWRTRRTSCGPAHRDEAPPGAALAATDDPAHRRQLEAADAEVDRLAAMERLLATAHRIELGKRRPTST